MLVDGFRWLGDRTDDVRLADLTGWWRDAAVLAALGPALAAPFRDLSPTVVIGPQSRGCLLGPLVATSMGVGFVEVRKDPVRGPDSELRRTLQLKSLLHHYDL